MSIIYHSNFNLSATGLIAGLLEVQGEIRDFETEPAELCQGYQQGNGVFGVTEFSTQVRIRCSDCMLVEKCV